MKLNASPRGALLNTVFLKCTALIALAAAMVAIVLSVQSSQMAAGIAREGVASNGEQVTGFAAAQAGGAFKFSKSDALLALIEEVLAKGRGNATAGIAFALDGTAIVESGEMSETTRGTLAVLAELVLQSGEATFFEDGLLFAAPAPFGAEGQTAGVIAIAWSTDIIMASINEQMTRAYLLAGGLLAIALLASVVLLRSMISVPLGKIRHVMMRVAEGDLDCTVPMLKRGDEIGEIARSLDQFRIKLVDARVASLEAAFKSAGFQGSSAALMILDKSASIRFLNPSCGAMIARFVPEADITGTTWVGRSLVDVHQGLDEIQRIVMQNGSGTSKTALCIGDCDLMIEASEVTSDTGEVIGTILEIQDVSAQRLNEAILLALETRQVRAEFTASGMMLHANRNFETMLSETIGSFNNETVFDALHSDIDQFSDARSKIAAGQSLFGKFELRLNNAHCVIDGAICAVTDAKGQVTRIVVLGNDMTAADAAITKARTQREALEKAKTQAVDFLRAGLADLAGGKLTSRIETPFEAEYEQLRTDFNGALDQLQSTIIAIKDRTRVIGQEIGGISTASDSLAKRTEHQAATLEQTAAALAEITASVTSAADGAKRADEVVRMARDNAESSGEVVDQAVNAMGQIEESSDKISRIIGVIDQIAFQTNLLALNAGVEAARAGDAGRGFAVVASEVRALAQRSSEAAQEINSLISASGDHVKEGVSLVGRAGDALRGIVGSIGDIAQHVAEIATSSKEQSSGLVEVNSAMGQLDQVTQQNAAMFEETTAASHALLLETQELNKALGVFEIGAEISDHKVTAAKVPRLQADLPRKAPAIKVAVNAPGRIEETDAGWSDF